MTARATLFSLVAALIYTLAYYFDWPLFRYYSAAGFHVADLPAATGFSIAWYGWIATAVLAGAAAALLTPKKWAARLPPDLSWMLLIVLVAAVLVYEKRWFF